MTIVEMLVRGAALEPMFCGQGPDIRGRSNARVIQAAKDYVQATGGASSFSVEIVNKRCGHAVLLSITKSAIRKRRWLADVRRYSDLDTVSSPHLAEIVLRGQKIDLIVLSSLRDSDLHRIINLSDGADVLVLDGLTMPSELLSLIAQRLNRHERRA